MKKIIMLFVYSVLMAFNACDNNTDYELSDATPEFFTGCLKREEVGVD